jgi:hypothetical protein
MGTKANPSKYDCFKNLEDDEPYFVLMARDPRAAALVRAWAWNRRELIKMGAKPAEDEAQCREADDCADAMEAWFLTHRGDPVEEPKA